jgi:hypothetical protein
MAACKGARPPNAEGTYPEGSPNKVTRALKDTILQALDAAGRVEI